MTWFERLTGFRETSPEEVRRRIAVEGETMNSRANGRSWAYGRLETPTLGELRARAGAADRGGAEGRDTGVGVTLREVVADVQALHADPANAGAMFQVASQFNLLEMTSPNVTPERGVGGYEYDRTQGPACAIACGAGTIYRNYFVPLGGDEGGVPQVGQTAERQIDCLADLGAALGNGGGEGVGDDIATRGNGDGEILGDGGAELEGPLAGLAGAARAGGRLWTMRNGYALASERGLIEIGERLSDLDEAGRDALRAQLRIGLQWDTQVTLGEARHRVSQAYCSALPVAYSPHESALWEPFARLVLEAAYEAALWAAVVKANRGGADRPGRARVYLTLLGGGAFGNETVWIVDALERAMRCMGATDAAVEEPRARPTYHGSALDVAVVSYGQSKPAVRELVARWG